MYKCDKHETERRLYCMVMQKTESDEIFDFIISFEKLMFLKSYIYKCRGKVGHYLFGAQASAYVHSLSVALIDINTHCVLFNNNDMNAGHDTLVLLCTKNFRQRIGISRD